MHTNYIQNTDQVHNLFINNSSIWHTIQSSISTEVSPITSARRVFELKMTNSAWEANSLSKTPSPMMPFKDGLKHLKCLGLPLEFKNEQATKFADKGRFWKCILFPGCK